MFSQEKDLMSYFYRPD